MLNVSLSFIGFVIALGIVAIIAFFALVDEIAKTVVWFKNRRKKSGTRQVGRYRNRKVTSR
jgi:hypothetical protein